MRDCPLEGQIQAYWRACHDLRLARDSGGEDFLEVEEIADLARFTDHPPLKYACLSHLKCSVVEFNDTQAILV
jgi:hypothetical protein